MTQESFDVGQLEARLNERFSAYDHIVTEQSHLIEAQSREISNLKWALQTSLEGEVNPNSIETVGKKSTSRRSALKMMALAGLGVGALSGISAATATPTAFAQVKGNPQTSDPTTPSAPPGSAANTRYITITGQSFKPRESATTYADSAKGGIQLVAGTAQIFEYNLRLPDGATIVSVDFYHKDTDANDLGFAAYRYDHSVDTFVTMGSASSATNAAGIRVATISTLTSNTVDNNAFSYVLATTFSAAGATQVFLGARVGYNTNMEIIAGRGDNNTTNLTRTYYSGGSSTGGALFVFEDGTTYSGSGAIYPAVLAGWATGSPAGVPNGIYGYTDVADGAGIVGYGGSSNNYGGRFYGGKAQVLFDPAVTAGAPAVGTHAKGELLVDSAGKPFFCVTAGTPGTWGQVGLINFLTSPVRVAASTNSGGTLALLTSSGNPADPGATAQIIQITGANVPAAARAIVCSITSVGATTAGNLRIWPDGATAPTVNSLNIPLNSATGTGFNLTTAATVALSAAGKVKLAYNNSNSTSTCGFSIDIVAYIM